MIGKVATLWAWLDWHKTQKVDNAPVGLYARVAVFLTNLHSCCYNNETAQYFVVAVPTVEEYLHNF
jgi:hypothetical protein